MFASNTNAAAQSNTRAKGEFEPAIGFINVYLPSQDGGKVKLGTLPLKASKDREKALFDALSNEQKRDLVLAALKDKLQFDFQSAEQSAAKGFDLGIDL